MNQYKIPEDRIDDFVGVFWQLLRSVEIKADAEKLQASMDKMLVDGCYSMINDINMFNDKSIRMSDWERRKEK